MEKLEEYGCNTTTKIANDVVCKIAAIAALEVEGVSSMGNNITTEILGKVGIKNLLRNVKIEVLGKELILGVVITVEYGYSIPAVSQKVQARIKQAVENMTGLTVADVNVRVSGISTNKEA